MSNKNTFPAYFLQSKNWAQFWVEANLPGHKYHEFGVWDDLNSIELKIFVYEYPWYFGKKFWYIPKGLAGNWLGSKKDILIRLFQELWEKIITQSKLEEIAFIKSDWDHQWLESLEMDIQGFSSYLSVSGKLETKLNSKTIQYLQTITLATKELILNSTQDELKISLMPVFQANELVPFFEQNRQWWSQTNQNIRRYTKKSLTDLFSENKFWQVDTLKSEANFQEFWRVYELTSSRQDFAIHPQSYIRKLYFKDMSCCILLKDTNGLAQAVWLGIYSEDTLTYLYGGNTQDSFDKYGQYLIHLVALKLASEAGSDWYDLGGYDSQKGFGSFKEGYRGLHRVFAGPIDVINNYWLYLIVLKIVDIIKSLRSWIKRSSY